MISCIEWGLRCAGISKILNRRLYRWIQSVTCTAGEWNVSVSSKSIAITADLYTHVLQEAKEKAAQQVGAAIFGKQDDANVEKMQSNAPKEK